MSLIEGGWITESTEGSKGSFIFKVDKLNNSPLINAEAKGVLRIIGDVAVNVTNTTATKEEVCEKSCKLKLNDKVTITPKVPGSIVTFGGDCTASTCEVTINKPYQVVVVSTPTVTQPAPTIKYVTLTVKTADTNSVEGTVELTTLDGKVQKCAGVKLDCSFQYPENTKVSVGLKPNGGFIPDDATANLGDGKTVDISSSPRTMHITFSK